MSEKNSTPRTPDEGPTEVLTQHESEKTERLAATARLEATERLDGTEKLGQAEPISPASPPRARESFTAGIPPFTTPAASPATAPQPATAPAPVNEPPKGARWSTLVWGLIVIAVGALIILGAAGLHLNMTFVTIGLLVAAGTLLIVGAIATAVRRDRG